MLVPANLPVFAPVDQKFPISYNMGIVNDKEQTMSAIPAKDVGRVLLETLYEAVAEEFPEATEAERDESVKRILCALGGVLYKGPKNS